MKILLTTLNARFIHSALSLRYLNKFILNNEKLADSYQLIIKEYTINDHLEKIMADIYQTGAQIIGFSCYIWNISQIMELADRLKKVKPELIIILGGPEVSYDSVDLLKKHRYLDYIISGEGEKGLSDLLTTLLLPAEGRTLFLSKIPGITYRVAPDQIKRTDPLIPVNCNFEEIPRPYNPEDLQKLTHKIVYYETSRGCPFKCSYCLSSTIKGIRYFPLARVKEDLQLFIEKQIELVKFVDRTFNANKKRAMEIFEFLVDNQGQTKFHFEVAADLFDREMIDFLCGVPDGLFQFEIGVQSTRENTLKAIERKMIFSKVADNVRKLRKAGNINLHLDLIAGLPNEDYISFKESFDDVFNLAPHMLQLGFLKLLRGSKIRAEAEVYGYKFTTSPPYEVLANDTLNFSELIKLKEVEDVLDRYYNSGAFKKSLRFLLNRYYESPFQLFEELASFFKTNHLNRKAHSRKSLYDIFFRFFKQNFSDQERIFRQYLKFDLIFHNRGFKLPSWANSKEIPMINDIPFFKEKRYHFLEDEENLAYFLPSLQRMPVKTILGKVEFALFEINVLRHPAKVEEKQTLILFDYDTNRAHDITDKFFEE